MGEEQTLRDRGLYMRKFGSTEEQVVNQVGKLSRANLTIYPQDEQQGLIDMPSITDGGEHDGQSVPDSPRSRWVPSEADLPSAADFSPTSPLIPTDVAESGDEEENPDDVDLSGRPRWISPFDDPLIEATSMLGILKASADYRS